MFRQVQLCLLVAAVSACSSGPRTSNTPVAFATSNEAVRRICISPSSHRAVVKAVRTLNWRELGPDAIPEPPVDNGMITWSEVVVSPGRDMMVATGRLGGTSYCRIYVRRAASSPVEDLGDVVVLGAPLGHPDFRQAIDGSDVTGWHKRSGRDWRAVHIAVAEPRNAGGAAMPVMIEVTRSTS